MEFLMNYWYIILIIIAAIAVGGYTAFRFFKESSEEQITKVKEWLLYAVAIAEKELGSGTGQIKLRQTYDAFVTKFPWIAKMINFQRFSELVDEVLKKFNQMLIDNPKLLDYVNGAETQTIIKNNRGVL